MDTEGFIRYVQGLPRYQGHTVHRHEMPARPPRYGDLEHPLAPAMKTL